MVGAAEAQKTGIVAQLVEHPEMRIGASDAIKTVAEMRRDKTIWEQIKALFGF